MPKPSPRIPLPKGWPTSVKSAILHVIALAQFAMTYARGWAADSVNTRVRLKAELDQANQDNALLREEMRIKDARMAKAFLITAATVASWLRRVDEQGPNALLQLRTPVNRFPDFVRYVVQRLKALCPGMGQVKMAQTLARAGLHLGATTVRRILTEKPLPTPSENDNTVTGHWYNEHRPHATLHGRTPNEVCAKRFPANRTPRFELRECWPLGSPCSRPWALVRGQPGAKVQFDVAFHAGRRHLPVVSVKRAA